MAVFIMIHLLAIAGNQSTIGSSQAPGRLDYLRLLVVVEDSSLALNVLYSLSVNVVDLDDVVGDVRVVLAVIVDDALRVQMVSVHCCDDRLVVCCVIAVLSHDCLQVGVVCLEQSLLSWQLNHLGCVDAWSDGWWSVA